LSGKAEVTHSHAITEVTGLQAALDGKSPVAHIHAFDDLSDVSGATAAAVGYILIKAAGGWQPSSAIAALGTHSHAITDVTNLQTALDLLAPLASAALTGTPTAPTAVPATNTTQLATTAFVKLAFDELINAAPGTLDTLDEIAAALGDDPNFVTTITSTLAGKVAIANLVTTAQWLANTAGKILTTDQVWASAAFVALTDAATITVDGATFINASVTITANRALGTWANPKPGQCGIIAVKQDVTGSRTLSYHADYEFAGGAAIVLSTAPNAEDLIFYSVRASGRIVLSLLAAVS